MFGHVDERGGSSIVDVSLSALKYFSNDVGGIEEEGYNGVVVMIVDVVGVGKSTERGTSMESKDSM
ncbi:hypothetical protein KI387_037147, partial [Taxus chinensis]